MPSGTGLAGEWAVPVAGNAFRVAPEPLNQGGRRGDFDRDGALTWGDAEAVHAIFFRVSGPARLELGLVGRSTAGNAKLVAAVAGNEFPIALSGSDFERVDLGTIEVTGSEYVRVELRGRELAGGRFGEVRELTVSSDADVELAFVRSNEGNLFYWGRRGPSVHLTYRVPRDAEVRYAYSEITVPEGEDPIGSYFMANGFGEGYFGIQVNGPEERRVLFSVWSPFRTDNPREIPEDQRIVAVGRGPGVRVGEFGNEGSGGQSFLVYPWRAGVTYRFLTEVRPDGPDTTRYTSWFGDKAAGEWRLIASFRRPQTQTYLRRFHSFLENFQPFTGHIERRGMHGNVWVRDTAGNWHECTEATFSVDATGGGKHRLDFTGGAEGDRFYLRNCGFFAEPGRPGERFTRASSGDPPNIDWDSLPQP